jgi:hypothetical protein
LAVGVGAITAVGVAATVATAVGAALTAELAVPSAPGKPLDEQAERRIALLSTTRTNRRTRVLAFL